MFSSQLILVLLFKFGKRMSFAALIIIAAAVICSAQSSMDYSLQGQAPSFTNADPFPGGFVNVSNGNVHLEIPLGNYPQRGGSALQAAVTYDSRIWMPFNNGSYTIWMSQAQYPRDWIANGWAYSTNRWPGSYSSASAILPCNGGSLANTQLGPFVWTDLKLSSHAFPVIVQAGDCPGQILSGDAYALDGSGYHLFIRYVRNPGVPTGSIANWAVTVYDKEGNVEYHTFTSNSTIENRTAISSNGNGLGSTSPSTYPCYSNLDTLARSIFVGCNYQLAPINVTWNNQFHVFSLPTSKNVSGNFSLYPTWLPTTTASTTNFHQSGVQESNLNGVTILPSLTIQDGSTYTFTYDCDSNLGSPCGSPSGLAGYTGQLIKITWPTGATVSFTYQNFTDANGHTNSWVKTVTTPDGVRTYIPATGCGAGCQTMTVTHPSGDQSLYTFTLNKGNGAWATTVQHYTGSVGGTPVMTVQKTYQSYATDPTVGNFGYTLPLTTTTTIQAPSGPLTKQTSYIFDNFTYTYNGNTYTGSLGKLLSASDYAFGNGTPGPLLRKTTYSYWDDTHPSYKTANILGLVSDVLVQDGNGNKISETATSYDTTALSTISNVWGHDDTNYGPTNLLRGNPTLIKQWVNGSNYLSTTLYYDTTGQLVQSIDPALNSTTFSYTDNFYVDPGDGPSNPPQSTTPSSSGQPTNAYLTQVSTPLIPASTIGYYYGTGQVALSTDSNGATSKFHFYDALNRPTSFVLPNGGWAYSAYNSSHMQVDQYTGITGAFSTSGCSSCSHDQVFLDALGRRTTQTLVSDPDGATSVLSSYDPSGRILTVSHPQRTSASATDGTETFTYDSLSRIVKVTHTDGTIAQTIYGVAVPQAGGLASQQCAVSTCGTGFPLLNIDETGRPRQTWVDALSRIIEVDEPQPSLVGTAASGTATVSGTEQTSGGTAAPGTGSITISGSERTTVGPPYQCGYHGQDTCYPTIPDVGTVSIAVNGFSKSASYGTGSTSSTLASTLASAFNSDSASPVTASASNSVVTLVAKATGANTNYSLSATSVTGNTQYFSGTSFPVSTSGSTLTGGQTGGPVTYDSGTVWVSVNGTQASVTYGQGDTPATVAQRLQSSLGSLPVTATVSGAVISLTSNTTGPNGNYSLAGGSSTNQPGTFASPSFTVGVSGSHLTGGTGPSFGSPLVTTHTYTFDSLGGHLQVVQGGRTRTYNLDGLNRVISECIPETGPSTAACGTTYTYYTTTSAGLCAGNASAPCRVTDPKGITSTYSYDQLNRLIGVLYSDGTTPSLTYCYDGQNTACLSGFTSANPNARRTAMKDGSGATGWSYNTIGSPLVKQRTTNGVTQSFSYAYNIDNSVSTVTYPSGRVITYGYSGAQRPITAADVANQLNYVTGATYWPTGVPMAIVHAAAPGNSQAINETYAYNNRLQLTGINDSSASGPLLNLTFGYSQTSGNNGSVASVANNSDGSRTQTFTYDSLNRILSAQSQATSGTNCWGLNFGIDAIANLLSENVTKCSANPLSVSVNAKNWITNTNFNYDADGNLTSNGGSPYVYDAESRVTSAAGTSYSYDGNGLRVMKSGGTIYWRGVGGNTLAETTGSGGLTSEYIFFGGRRIARRDSSNNVSYYLTDHLGSVRVVTNSSGAPCYQADYTPYGLEMTPAGVTNTCPLNYKFTGYERDTESGLDYAIARYYSSGLGRFVSVDPMGGSASDPQSWNAYSYVHNKPLNFTDPSGLCSEDDTSDCPGYGGGILTYGSGSGSSGGFSWSWWFGSSDVPPWDPYYYSLPLGGFNVGVVSPDTHYVYTYHAISIPSQSYPSDGSILSHMANDCSNCIGTFGGAYDMVETAASLTAQAGLIVSGFEFPLVAKFLHALTLASNVPVPDGSFSIRDWSGYPEGLPRPQGPFRRLSPIEYKDARQAANAANRALRSQTPGIEGMEVHEIHPVILGGSPTSLSNKAILTEEMHSAYTIWWNRVLRAVRTIPE